MSTQLTTLGKLCQPEENPHDDGPRIWSILPSPAGITASRGVCAARSCSAKGRTRPQGMDRDRLQELAEIFAVSVGGFSVMDNHLHVLVRLDPDIGPGVVGRGSRAALGAAVSAARQVPAAAAGVRDTGSSGALKDGELGRDSAQRLQSLSWFMKCLKEPLSRLANRQDKARERFSRGGSRASRSSMKKRCWRPAPTSI